MALIYLKKSDFTLVQAFHNAPSKYPRTRKSTGYLVSTGRTMNLQQGLPDTSPLSRSRVKNKIALPKKPAFFEMGKIQFKIYIKFYERIYFEEYSK